MLHDHDSRHCSKHVYPPSCRWDSTIASCSWSRPIPLIHSHCQSIHWRPASDGTFVASLAQPVRHPPSATSRKTSERPSSRRIRLAPLSVPLHLSHRRSPTSSRRMNEIPISAASHLRIL